MITSRLHGLWLGILNWKIIALRLSGSVHREKLREYEEQANEALRRAERENEERKRRLQEQDR